MVGFESGIRYYTRAMVELAFPEDRVCCEFCHLLETHPRKQCRRTGEYIADTRTIGYACPLIPVQECENNDEKESL